MIEKTKKNKDDDFTLDDLNDMDWDMDEGISEWPVAEIQQETNRPLVTWKNRRRMAWVCLVTMIIFMGFLVFDGVPESRIDSLEPIITTFLYVLGGVIVAYMGFTSLPFFGMGGKGKR